MRISELFRNKKTVISFEVFPPKKDSGFESVFGVIGELSGLCPDFVSVTCGAGGAGNGADAVTLTDRTHVIAAALKREHGVEPLAHMTCVMSERDGVLKAADALKKDGIENILALRGDQRDGASPLKGTPYRYASQLIEELAKTGDFCVGAACYPEGHIECDSLFEDLLHLREKQDRGASFLITQLFFDNDTFFRFLDKAGTAGITIPVSAGIMPILSNSQIGRMVFMCGASLPSDIIRLLHKYKDNPSDLRKAGIEHAVIQMEALVRGGAAGIHVYTMNHPDIAASAMNRLSKSTGRRQYIGDT